MDEVISDLTIKFLLLLPIKDIISDIIIFLEVNKYIEF